MLGRVLVTLKREVLDPQGDAVARGLAALDLSGVRGVRVGKVIEVSLDPGLDRDAALALLNAAADGFLANPVLETWSVELVDEAASK